MRLEGSNDELTEQKSRMEHSGVRSVEMVDNDGAGIENLWQGSLTF